MRESSIEIARMKMILPFNYKRIDERFNILTAIIGGIVDNDLSIIELSIQEMVDNDPNKETEYFKLYKKAIACHKDLQVLCHAYLLPVFANNYILTDAWSLGIDLGIELESIQIDYSVEYQRYMSFDQLYL